MDGGGQDLRFSLQEWQRLHGCLESSVEMDPEAVSRLVWKAGPGVMEARSTRLGSEQGQEVHAPVSQREVAGRHSSASPCPVLGTAEVGVVNMPSLSGREVLFKYHSYFDRSRKQAEKVKVGLERQLLIKASMHLWKAGDETGSVQDNVLYKTYLEKMGAFINLCHQSATEKGCKLFRNRKIRVCGHTCFPERAWREQYKVWLLSFIYVHIYIALGW